MHMVLQKFFSLSEYTENKEEHPSNLITMKQSTILRTIFLLCWILIILPRVQGSPLLRNIRCRCIKSYDAVPNVKVLQKLEVIPQSSSCSHTEIIATIKRTQEQRCLNPDSKQIQNLIKLINNKRSTETSKIRSRNHPTAPKRMD
ncbi:C-X-C motif chemokine 10-like [Monodelphis domestica]|uniref:C-X-C motif chemokine 10 n=1 Tax=Monodelphis domestica TaxID=13616 RepID=F7AQZ1_MONDO|nr:C-X-C motif chemokine 10-like [Monodelphis domestica]